jgi:hypothetical protein
VRQDVVAHARLGGDDGEDVDHENLLGKFCGA